MYRQQPQHVLNTVNDAFQRRIMPVHNQLSEPMRTIPIPTHQNELEQHPHVQKQFFNGASVRSSIASAHDIHTHRRLVIILTDKSHRLNLTHLMAIICDGQHGWIFLNNYVRLMWTDYLINSRCYPQAVAQLKKTYYKHERARDVLIKDSRKIRSDQTQQQVQKWIYSSSRSRKVATVFHVQLLLGKWPPTFRPPSLWDQQSAHKKVFEQYLCLRCFSRTRMVRKNFQG